MIASSGPSALLGRVLGRFCAAHATGEGMLSTGDRLGQPDANAGTLCGG
jgi:hypothetical protein